MLALRLPPALKADIERWAKKQNDKPSRSEAIRRLIEFASSFYTLYPGDVFYTGTPSGVGPVKPGDVITLESPPIGTMTVPVRAHVHGKS